MNYNKIKMFSAVLLFASAIFYSQKSKTQSTAENAVAIEPAKKIAGEEKAQLAKPYNPAENADARIAELVTQAKAENKNILVQAGGNWCIWCLRFSDFLQKTPELKQIVDENFLYYHLNFSPDNKNEKVFAKYDNPGQKYGYPVFVVLNRDGKMIHTQDSAVLEEGKGYSKAKVREFLLKWAVKS